MSLRAEQLLERAVEQARRLTVSREQAETRARETMRWGRAVQAAERRSRWRPLLAVTAGAAVAAILGTWWWLGPDRAQAPLAITDVGEHVALAPAPGALFSVVESSPSSTLIRVVAGEVTARLYRGAAGHRLIVAAGDIRFEAIGTIYTVVMPDTGTPYALVHEGVVRVVDARGQGGSVPAGAVWPPHRRVDLSSPTRAAERLRRHRSASSATSAGPIAPAPAGRGARSGGATEPASAEESAPPSATPDAAPPRAGDRGARPAGAAGAPAAEAAEDVWRRARLLRGQGRYRDALLALTPLSTGGDPVWAPIAHLERMRIHATMSDPRAVRDLGAQFRIRWPAHELLSEATALYCTAAREVDPVPPAECQVSGPRPGPP